jgi:hypothetical protein
MKPKRNNLQKDILFIFISSFIVVAAWIGFNIYHIWATSTVNQDLQLELMPISPVFDPDTIQRLKTRESIQPLFESQQSTQTTPTPIVIATPIPTPASIQTSTSSLIPTLSQTGAPSTIPSGTSQISPSNSPIDRVGQ